MLFFDKCTYRCRFCVCVCVPTHVSLPGEKPSPRSNGTDTFLKGGNVRSVERAHTDRRCGSTAARSKGTSFSLLMLLESQY